MSFGPFILHGPSPERPVTVQLIRFLSPVLITNSRPSDHTDQLAWFPNLRQVVLLSS